MEPQVMADVGIERRNDHLRAEIGTTDADVDDVADAARGGVADALGEIEHAFEHIVDRVALRTCFARSAEGSVLD